MRKLIGALAAVAVFAWTTAAFAGDYSALEDSGAFGPSAGVGVILLSGNNGTGDSDSEMLPTINLSGLCESVAWQVFYGFGSDSSVFGGSVDYIFAHNFDECATCPQNGIWWFGGGLTLINYSDLFTDSAAAGAAISATDFGVNVGGGYRWDEWGLDAYLHYLPDPEIFGVQAALLYNFNSN